MGQERPILSKDLDAETFRDFYYLKTELTAFCRKNGIQPCGSKADLIERIAQFLADGIVSRPPKKRRQEGAVADISLDTRIEEHIVCSEKHRAFFREHIGRRFSFFVAFQNWLKENAGRTYREAVAAWYRLTEERKRTKTTIGGQFAYNAYVRDFFADNPGASLADAITCWNYKKSLRGDHRYEKVDLAAICEG